jgi:hypothetical protein
MGLDPGHGDVVVAGSVQRALRQAQLRAEWSFRLVPEAFEGGGAWITPRRADRTVVPSGKSADPTRSMREAGRRARTTMRRYAVANRCDRMITLTYVTACHDRDEFVADLHGFWRDLRKVMGGTARPYVWVPEWHKTHGPHAHAAVSEYVPFSTVRDVWGRGRVRIERMAGAPIGQARAVVAERSRICARYLAKYVSKDFGTHRRVLGRHRYEVAEGFQPAAVVLRAPTRDLVLAEACERMQGPSAGLRPCVGIHAYDCRTV